MVAYTEEVKLAKIADSERYVYKGYGIGFNSHSRIDRGVGIYVIIFGVLMSSSVDIDNKGKDILILGKGLTKKLNDTMLTAEVQYSVNLSR